MITPNTLANAIIKDLTTSETNIHEVMEIIQEVEHKDVTDYAIENDVFSMGSAREELSLHEIEICHAAYRAIVEKRIEFKNVFHTATKTLLNRMFTIF